VAEWDAIIVGAGPAGSALACRLRPECRVLLLDRLPPQAAQAPHIGESLPGAAGALLQRCGAFDRFAAAGHAERGATVSQWDNETPVWFDHLRDPHGSGWHLDRARFDSDLRASAVVAGARLIVNCGPLRASRRAGRWQVVDETATAAHCAWALVDATGRNAAISRQLGLVRRVEDALICLYAYLPPIPGDLDHCTLVCADDNGWWYSVRLPSGWRVLAFHLDADDPELSALRALPALLGKARRHALLARVLPVDADETVHARPAGSAALDPAVVAQTAPGFFAIGDAGLSFDPIASQGLFHALASAESAANVIGQGSSNTTAARDAFLEEMATVRAHYRQRLHDTYAAPLRYQNCRFWSRRRAA
jgi:flavin-dependent dehydrogenase